MNDRASLTAGAIAERLRKARALAGLKPKEMAERAGIAWNSYKDYEAGKTVPGGVALAGLLQAGVDVTWLLSGRAPILQGVPPADVAALAEFGAAMLRQQASTRAVADARAALPQSLIDRFAGSGR